MINRVWFPPILFLALITVPMNGQPKAGDWKVTTRFGQFVFTVNSAGTQIVKLATTFSNYSFGGITQNGTLISLPSPGWPISNNQFAITTSINPSGTIKLTLTGSFTPSGEQASGTWSMLVSGQTDSDPWGPTAFTPSATGQWSRTSGPYTGQICCLAVSGTRLFAGTDGGGVFLSSDDGSSWSGVNTGCTNTRVFALSAAGGNLFGGTLGGVFLSTNNGTSWTAASTGLTNTSVRALAISGANLYAGTFGGGVFFSSNYGTNWTESGTGLTNKNITALAVDGSNLLAATSTGGVFRSTNNGAGWTAVNTGLTNTYVPALTVSGTGLFAGTYDGVFVSTNNGTNWTKTSLAGTVATSFAISGSNLFAGTIIGVFLSTDNGKTWKEVNSGMTDTNVWSLAVLGANLYAGTMYSGVWKRPLAEMVTPVERYPVEMPTQFSLEQNYPNPFNLSTTITYELPKAATVSLKIFNVLGQEVAMLVNERKEVGNFQATWNANVPSGVYFYRLQAREFVETKKLILLR